MWWLRVSPVDEDGEDVLLSEVLSEAALAPALRVWGELYTAEELTAYDCDGAEFGAKFMMEQFRFWTYRPVHSFVHALQNDWEDRALAEAVLRAVDEFLNLYGLYQTQYDQFDVPRDHVGDEVGPGDY